MKDRTPEQAKIHDWVIRETIKNHYDGRTKSKITSNPNGAKNKDVQGRYPDIVVYNDSNILIIEEIETLDSVNETELKNQWEPYSKLTAKKFILTVPKEKIHIAAILTKNIQCELWYYEIKKDKLISSKFR